MIADLELPLGAAALLGALVFATDAYPQSTVTFGDAYYGAPMPQDGSPMVSTVTIAPSQFPGALASVTFDNVAVNDDADTGQRRDLVGQGITVGVEFRFNADAYGADQVTLTPPDGVMCHPSCEITVQEGMAETVTLYDSHAVGS